MRFLSTSLGDNPARALTFVRELRKVAAQLAQMPDGYPLIPRYERQGVRRRTYRDYLILYRVEKDKVAILDIVHGARDYETLLRSKDE